MVVYIVVLLQYCELNCFIVAVCIYGIYAASMKCTPQTRVDMRLRVLFFFALAALGVACADHAATPTQPHVVLVPSPPSVEDQYSTDFTIDGNRAAINWEDQDWDSDGIRNRVDSCRYVPGVRDCSRIKLGFIPAGDIPEHGVHLYAWGVQYWYDQDFEDVFVGLTSLFGTYQTMSEGEDHWMLEDRVFSDYNPARTKGTVPLQLYDAGAFILVPKVVEDGQLVRYMERPSGAYVSYEHDPRGEIYSGRWVEPHEVPPLFVDIVDGGEEIFGGPVWLVCISRPDADSAQFDICADFWPEE